MIPKSKRKSERKIVVDIDFTDAHKTVQERVSADPLDKAIPTSELLKRLRKFKGNINIKDQMIYTWRREGIIDAENNDDFISGKIQYFKEDQVKRAFMAAYLKERQCPNAEIAGAVTVWSSPVLLEKSELMLEIDDTGRALQWLKSRILAAIAGISLGSSRPPKDADLICFSNPAIPMEQQKFKYYPLTDFPDFKPEGMFLGSSNKLPNAEIYGRVTYNQIRQRYANKKLYGVQINSPDNLENPCEIIFVIKEDSEDHVAQLLKNAVDGIVPEVIDSSFQELYCLVNYLFVHYPMLKQLWEEGEAEYRLPDSADYLQGLTTAVLAQNDNWVSCAVFAKEEVGILKKISWSPKFPMEEEFVSINSNNLESWVFKTGEFLVLDRVSGTDPRIPPDIRRRSANPFAVVPAISSEGIEGVLKVYSRHSTREVPSPFDVESLTMLHFFGGVLGESIVRERICNIDHILQPPLISRRDYPGESNLRERLTNLLEDNIREPAIDSLLKMPPKESIVLFAIKLRSPLKPQYKAWFADQLCDRLSRFQPQKAASHGYSAHYFSKIYKIDLETIIGLVARYVIDESFPQLRNEMQGEIDAFFSMYPDISAHMWSVYFMYDILRNRLIESKEPQSTGIPHQVETIMGHAQRAARNAKILREADRFMREGNYRRAYNSYQQAYSEDDPYVLRHLSQASAGLGDWPNAIEYARLANSADKKSFLPKYAGSYLRMGEALIGNGDVEKGIDWFRDAAKFSQDVFYQLELAKILINYGKMKEKKDYQQEAIDILNRLIASEEVGDKAKSIYCVLQAKAFRDFNDLKSAEDSLNRALEFDPTNQLAHII